MHARWKDIDVKNLEESDWIEPQPLTKKDAALVDNGLTVIKKGKKNVRF